MKLNQAPIIVIALAAAAALGGCTASASVYSTAPAQDVADLAASALEDQVGFLPTLDCGDEPVKLIENETVECLLTAGDDPTTVDTTVTITDVDGSKYSVGVEVADSVN